MCSQPVLLVNPRSATPPWPTPPRAVEPLGVLYTAAAFRGQGIETRILDLETEPDSRVLSKELLSANYGLVGITLTSQPQTWSAFASAQEARSLCPGAKVVVGGVFATLNARWILETCPAIDAVCRGEGENLAAVYGHSAGATADCEVLATRENLLALPPARGLPYYSDSLDSYPLPARDLLSRVLESGGLPSVVASRGCGACCTFCAVPAYSGVRWRMRSASAVVEEMSALARRSNAKRFHLIDDNLFGHHSESRQRGMSLLEALASMKPGVEIRAACRLDDLTGATITALRRAGVVLLKLGVETLDPASQSVYGKRLPCDAVEGRLRDVLAAGIGVSLGMILFDPFCSMASVSRNFEFLRAYPTCWARHLLRSTLAAYAGTAIEQQIVRAGLAVSRSAFGTVWRFQDDEVARFHARLETSLKAIVLPAEWDLYELQAQSMANGNGLDQQRLWHVDRLLRELYIEAFERALTATAPVVDGPLALRGASVRREIACLLNPSVSHAAC